MKRIEYTKENLRLIAFIISSASSGTLFTKLLNDSGWEITNTLSEEYRKSGRSKEDYLFDQFNSIAENGRVDVLEFIMEKTLSKSSVYFKKGDKDYKFPRDAFAELKKKVGKKDINTQKKDSDLFNQRKLHESAVFASGKLFSAGFYSQAIFEACKLLNKRVQELSKSARDGKSLMLEVFSVNCPILKITNNESQSDKDEQEGFMHLFAGVMHGIRNPKGHELIDLNDPFRALEYLGLISLLFRKLDELK